jgi:hypothetical protein
LERRQLSINELVRARKQHPDALDDKQIKNIHLAFQYQNGRYFHDPPGGIERWSRTQGFGIEEDARKKAISAGLDDYFNKLGREDRELAMALLSRIFPSLWAYQDHSDDPPSQSGRLHHNQL